MDHAVLLIRQVMRFLGRNDVAGVIVRNGAAICPECLRACSDILADS